MKMQVWSLASFSVAMSYGVCCRCGLDPKLLWLWCRPAAVAPIGPLAWELPYAVGSALKSKKKKEEEEEEENKCCIVSWTGSWNRERSLVKEWWNRNEVCNPVNISVLMVIYAQNVHIRRRWMREMQKLFVLPVYLFCKSKMISRHKGFKIKVMINF